MRKGPVLGSLPIHGEGGPTGIVWSADGRAVIAETRDQTLRMLDEHRAELWRLPGPPPRRTSRIVGGGQRHP